MNFLRRKQTQLRKTLFHATGSLLVIACWCWMCWTLFCGVLEAAVEQRLIKVGAAPEVIEMTLDEQGVWR